MNSSPAAQVEKVLEDLIVRLTKSPSTADVRAVLIEAKRLRNVTMRWSAIPPQPDARREMMARVMDLIAQIGLNAKDLRGTDPPPLNPPSRPPPKRPPTAPPPRPISRADASPTLEPKVQPARQDQAPSFRKFEELGQTRPRAPRAQESAAPRTSGPHSLRSPRFRRHRGSRFLQCSIDLAQPMLLRRGQNARSAQFQAERPIVSRVLPAPSAH